MGLNSLCPGDNRGVLASAPSRCFTTCVVRISAEHLLIPATYCRGVPHLRRNLKFLHGSKRCAFTVNWAMIFLFFRLGRSIGVMPSAAPASSCRARVQRARV